VVRAGVITFAALGIGWTDDGGVSDASASTPTVQDAGARTPPFDEPPPIPIYGTVPPPHRPGC
jgi:hypothetical protein